ncbi:bacterial Ig-like domain-containing protein [Leuconostoc falkenbergense]|uniref:bacterial Ig-like domain-containing protein n=1 Tax=Leuconostoc falkenbergense TaxID=2766470 RepID=UPI00295DB688|nr:DUF5011 domain-containing protein [Leuconostoc falkenbergense]
MVVTRLWHNKTTITDDQDFLDAWNQNDNGSYKVTYSVTDKDGNTTTKTINVTIYSNITIHYVDQDGKALQSDTTLIANSNGEAYSITPVTTITKENNVYNYVSTSSSLTGTYGSDNQPTEITLTYHASQTTIDAKDSTLVAGPNTKWTAADNFVSATDQAGNPVELKDITVTGTVDTTKAGQYDVTYSYTDANGNLVSKTITVTVVDSKAGIDAKDSTLVAGPNTKWTAADNFVSATDQAGNNVELKDITVTGTVDTTKAGQYDVTYSYTDANGNLVSKTITVTVVDSKAGIDAKDSTLVAGPNTKWTAGDNFISATDQAGNNVELKDITVTGTVDTTKAGQYDVTYSYTDANGNLVSKTITVTVLAPSSDSGSNSSHSKEPDSPTVKVSYSVTKNNNSGSKQLPDTGENSDGVVGSIVGAIFAASLGILTIINKKKNDN